MDSNLRVSKENTEDKIDMSDYASLKYIPKTIENTGKEEEIHFKDLKDDRRNTLNPQINLATPLFTEINSYFGQNNPFYREILRKKYLLIISKYEKIIEDISNMNKKIEDNSKEIEDLNLDLKKLKEEKKKNQTDIVNYLANKESLEEIYKNKVDYLINLKNQNKSKIEDNEININLDSFKSQSYDDSHSFNIEEEKEIEIDAEEIKKSDKNKFTEQVINLAEKLLQKKGGDEIISKIKSKIKIAYNIFFSEISSNSPVDYESVISHFFSRIGLYISNLSLGLYSETNINKFLRYLIKINSINVEIGNILKFLNKKYKDKKMEMRNKISNIKKKNQNLIDKKSISEKNIDKYEKIIQKNKEYLQNLNQNSNETAPQKGKRKYNRQTIDLSKLRKSNDLKIITDENNMNISKNYSKGNKSEELIDILPKNEITSENLIKDENIFDDSENTKKINSKLSSQKTARSKSKDKENKSKDSLKDKINSTRNKEMKNIIITKNTKITLRKSGNQNKIKDSDKQNEIKNKESNPEFKMINTSNNLNYFDDSKNVDSEINSKKKNNNKQINHKYIVIKNDINIKNIKKQINNNRYLNDVKTKIIKPLKPSSSGNKNIIKKDNDKKEKTYNSAQNKSKNIGEKAQKNLHNNINFYEPKTKYKKNIYIINNINNSQQIQTKNNIYGNKINNLKINSTGNLIFDNFNEKFNKTDGNINYTSINNNPTIAYSGSNTRKRPRIKLDKNINNNKEIDNTSKANYNFHDILHINYRKNNRIINIPVQDIYSNTNKNTTEKDNQAFATITYRNNNSKTQRVYQKNSYDYKVAINKEFNNNLRNLNKYRRNNIIKTPDNTNKASDGINNKNNSYKISIYNNRRKGTKY